MSRQLPIIAFATMIFTWLAAAAEVRAQITVPPPIKPGTKVLYKDGFTASDNGRVVDHQRWELPLVVYDTRGPFVQVGEGEKVWVERSSVLTLDEAPTYYTDLIDNWRSDQRLPWAYGMRAIARLQRNELDKAIDDFNAALRIRPNASIYINRSRAYILKKEFDRALDDLNQAMERGFRTYQAFLMRADAWRGKGDFNKAIEDYSEAIRLNPKATMAYCGRALAWRGKQDTDKALADYEEALRVNPLPFIYVSRGLIWKEKKQFDRASADFHKAAELGPNDAFATNSLAWFQATCPAAEYRDGKQAVELAQKALAILGPKSANALDTLAAAYAEAGDFDNAAKSEKECLELSAADSDFAKGARKRLALYEAHKPYRAE